MGYFLRITGIGVACCAGALAFAPRVCAVGADVIVGDLQAVQRFGRLNGITSYGVGTVACNIGTTNLRWEAGTRFHPVIAQNMYRLKSGRFEQVGQSWVKHGFFTVPETLCGNCNGVTGNRLGIGCSDPYSEGLNGSQPDMGPRYEINASTGVFPYPHAHGNQGQSGDVIYKRLQVKDADIAPAQNPGALVFVEGHYVMPDDADSGLDNNNVSYRRALVSEPTTNTFVVTVTDATERMKPAVFAWRDHGLGVGSPDPNVMLSHVDGPSDGRFWVASRATDLGGGTWHYEYAAYNLCSHRSAQSFSVPLPSGATVSNIGFHDVDYHSGEPFDGTDWPATVSGAAIAWETQTYATNQNANALRWGTLYNFRFDADAAPVVTTATVGLFRPGSPAALYARSTGPAVGDCNGNGIADDLDVSNATSPDCNADGVPDECQLPGNDCDGNNQLDECDLAGNDCNANGLPDACDLANNDCNADQIPDDCQLTPDCNGNGIPDDCDAAAGPDCDGNHVPDSCQPDCDRDGIIDACEGAPDCNANGQPDACDINGIAGGVDTYSSGTLNLPIPDANPTGVSHTINVPDAGFIDDVNLTLNITHTFDADLAVTVAHGGVTVTLASNVGDGANFTDTVFDDQAVLPINVGHSPFTGSFRPMQPLSTYYNANPLGPWTLKVTDGSAFDTGRLVSWALTIDRFNRPAVSVDGNSNSVPDECECPTCQGDMNGDGRLDGDDVNLFAAAMINGPFDRCGDMDFTGPPLTGADAATFVDRLLSATSCP